MKVFKFGGASVNNATAVRNVAKILNEYNNQKLLVVISAMGKTTNALERLCKSYFNQQNDIQLIFNDVKQYHIDILNDIFDNKKLSVFEEIDSLFDKLYHKISQQASANYDFEYDQIVSFGEIISTVIVSNYLNANGIANHWLDAREIIKTDSTFREGKLKWETTLKQIENKLHPILNNNCRLIITQGFIAGTENNYTTTLGREGSDYSAAIFAYGLNAEEMIIWKDVPGLLNADPKFFEDTIKLNAISYREAIELAYYGATIIHPKTIKPLQNKKIPLYVKSFLNPANEGSKIWNFELQDDLIPSFIFKKNQALISISPKDFSFIAEENLSEIFKMISANRIKINLMQNSAISFSICVDADNHRFDKLIEDLQLNFNVKYNTMLDLITIRHYNQQTIDKIVNNRKILLEQKSRSTAQMVVEN